MCSMCHIEVAGRCSHTKSVKCAKHQSGCSDVNCVGCNAQNCCYAMDTYGQEDGTLSSDWIQDSKLVQTTWCHKQEVLLLRQRAREKKHAERQDEKQEQKKVADEESARTDQKRRGVVSNIQQSSGCGGSGYSGMGAASGDLADCGSGGGVQRGGGGGSKQGTVALGQASVFRW
jgi:uncharacterized membrane protein YgcG